MRRTAVWVAACGIAVAQDVQVIQIGEAPDGKAMRKSSFRIGGPGGPGGLPANFKMPAMDPANEFSALLELPALQKELALGADEKAGLALLLDELKAGGKKFAEDWDKLPNQDFPAMGKLGQARKAAALKLVEEGLGDKSKRFKQIQRQLDGVMASLGDPEVSAALAVTPEQSKAMGAAMRTAFLGMGGGSPFAFKPGEMPSPEKMQEQMAQSMADMRKRSDEAALGAMSETQRKKWDEFVGAKVSFAKPLPKMPAFPAMAFPPAAKKQP